MNKSQTNIPQVTAAGWIEKQDQLTNLGGGLDMEGGGEKGLMDDFLRG